jgi:hypothetical protein
MLRGAHWCFSVFFVPVFLSFVPVCIPSVSLTEHEQKEEQLLDFTGNCN